MRRTIKIGPEAWAIEFKKWEDNTYVVILQRTEETQIETIYDLETFEEWMEWLKREYGEYKVKSSIITPVPEETP
jgi:hypothetical protein